MPANQRDPLKRKYKDATNEVTGSYAPCGGWASGALLLLPRLAPGATICCPLKRALCRHVEHNLESPAVFAVQVGVAAVQGGRAQFGANWFGRVDESDML